MGTHSKPSVHPARRRARRPRLETLEGRSVPSFGPPATYSAGTDPAAVAVADFNRDGFPDLASVNMNGHDVTILPGRGDGTFGPGVHHPLGTGSNPGSV